MHLRRPYSTNLGTALENRFRTSTSLSSYFKKARFTASELGEWCADRLWELALEDEEAAKLERKAERGFAADAYSRQALDSELEMIMAAKEAIKELGDLTHEATKTMGLPAISSKVGVLKEFLEAEYENPTEARCIVFVQRRSTARLLAELFQIIRSPHMRVGTLIGTRTAESGDMKVTIRQQMLTLMKFRQGEINVLFATSIAEEGLDIPLCNVIVRFDLYTTMIQYIQSRGRARHKQSKYIHMIEKGNPEHIHVLRDVRTGEQQLQYFCHNQPKDRHLGGMEGDFDPLLLKDGTYQIYREPATGAKLTFGTVLGQLDYFAACLGQNEETLSRPLYILSYSGKKFVCEVLLPATSPIRSVTGRPFSRKSIAKRSAAFEACLQLRRDGHLDENLLPIYHKQLPAMRNAQLALNVKKTNAYDMQIKPVFWEETWGSIPAVLCIAVVKVSRPAQTLGDRPLAPLLLLTREPLPRIPKFPVYLKPETRSDACIIPIPNKLETDEKTLELLTNFTLQCFQDPFNKGFKHSVEQMSYWLAPACRVLDPTKGAHSLIDWKAMAYAVENGQQRWHSGMSRSELQHRFFIDPHHGGTRYFTERVRPDMHAQDRPSPGIATANHKHWDTVLSYSCSLWKNSRDWIERFNKNQPVVEAYQIPFRRNWLDDFATGDIEVQTKAFICPEPLNISSVSLRAFLLRFHSSLTGSFLCQQLPCSMYFQHSFGESSHIWLRWKPAISLAWRSEWTWLLRRSRKTRITLRNIRQSRSSSSEAWARTMSDWNLLETRS